MADKVKGVEIDPVREKMIELMFVGQVLADAECDKQAECNKCPYNAPNACRVGFIADHLIANGVTMLTADEQRNIHTVQEIEELQNEAYDLGVDSALRHRFGLSWDDAAGLRKEVARLQVAAKWIPVSERLPEPGKRVLTFGVRGDGPIEYIDQLGYDGEWLIIPWEVTHWMPLPEPPKGE